jgi:hypothetical protein
MSIHRILSFGACALLLLVATQVGAVPAPPPPPEVNISGVWTVAGSGAFVENGDDDDKGDGGSCSYDGTIEFQQNGAQISGNAIIPLVAGDVSCPSMNGPVSGTVGGTTADFLVGGAVKGVGVEFCGDVIGETMSGDWQTPPGLPCFILKTAKGRETFRGVFDGERVPAQAPTLSIPALGLLIAALAAVGVWSSRRN